MSVAVFIYSDTDGDVASGKTSERFYLFCYVLFPLCFRLFRRRVDKKRLNCFLTN